jgi:hypothetical protein
MYIAIGIFGGLALSAQIQGAQSQPSASFPALFVVFCLSPALFCEIRAPHLHLDVAHGAGDDGSELLAVLTQSSHIHVFTKIMTYIFPLAAIITTIPIFSIIIRYASHAATFACLS